MPKYPHQPLSNQPYDPNWPNLFNLEKVKIEEKLGGRILKIEHIGSTSIEGISAKPIIDILIVVNSNETAKECILLLEELEYEYIDHNDQYYLRRSTSETTGFHLHMTIPENKFWKERLAFRNYLRKYPQVRKEYDQLKHSLIEKFGYDKKSYREGKQDFMTKYTDKALTEGDFASLNLGNIPE